MNNASSEPLTADAQQQRIEELEQEIQVLRAQLASQSSQSDAAASSKAEEVQRERAAVAVEHAQDVAGAKTRIRELKQARDTLRASEGWLRAILESATDYAIITLDLDGYITSWNSGARNILRWDEGEVLGCAGALFFTPEDRDAEVPQQEMRDALATGRAEDERWHLKKDGTRFWASGVVLPF